MIIRLIQKNPKRATMLVKGVTFKLGSPTSCRVRVYNRSTGELLSETISKSNGSYILFGNNFGSSYVVAIDPELEYNLASQDNVK
ncbi:hypothetical protein [Acinetobacter sp. YH01020]|uniref:hypothetical protein n=1 Tax=Acinetobacter sp. YH01020 TaxID=2601034 RepID=UPI0015D2BA31|nr:hypothetical protein [Acinetobacter sp. YH01020]